MQIDDETVAVARIRPGRECSRAHGRIEIEDDAQLAVGADRAADGLDGAGAARHLRKTLGEAAVLEIDDQAIRSAQREDIVLDGTTQVQNNACFVIF